MHKKPADATKLPSPHANHTRTTPYRGRPNKFGANPMNDVACAIKAAMGLLSVKVSIARVTKTCQRSEYQVIKTQNTHHSTELMNHGSLVRK